MKKPELIKAIKDLDDEFIKKTAISYLKDFKGWQNTPKNYLYLIKNKLEQLNNQFK